MNDTLAVELLRQMLWQAFWLSLPVLAASLLIGVLISLFQIAFALQDASISTVPRLITIAAVVAACLPWMLGRGLGYLHSTIQLLGKVAERSQ